MGRDWSLAAFTILGQMAVGLYLFAVGPLLFSHSWTASAASSRLLAAAAPARAPAPAVVGLLAAAAGLSLFHLHHPLRARRVLGNLKRSWLSREILFEILFGALAGFLALGAGRAAWPPALLKALAGLGALAGLLFLASMARLYMLSSVRIWKSVYTPVSFFLASLTTGLLGRMALAGMISPAEGRLERGPALAGLLLIGASLSAAALWAPKLGVFGFSPGPSLRPSTAAAPALHAVRLALLGLGAAALAAALWGGASGTAALGIGQGGAAAAVGGAGERVAASGGSGSGWGLILVLSAFFLASAGETLGRLLFYRT